MGKIFRSRKAKAGAAGVAALALTISFVGTWEGLKLSAYRDVVGVPTVCYGETLGVSLGDRYTKEQCDSMLVRRLSEFERGVSSCIQTWDELPVKTKISIVSWSYNVGVGGACKSTAVKRFNAGQFRSGCDAMKWWNKAGGRKIQGLVNRRASEHKLCVEDL